MGDLDAILNVMYMSGSSLSVGMPIGMIGSCGYMNAIYISLLYTCICAVIQICYNNTTGHF